MRILALLFSFLSDAEEILKSAENNEERKIAILKFNLTENAFSGSGDNEEKLRKSANNGLGKISFGIDKILERKSQRTTESCFLPPESRQFCKAKIRQNMNANPFAEFSSGPLFFVVLELKNLN